MSLSSTEAQAKEQSEPLLASNIPGLSSSLKPGMVYCPPSATGVPGARGRYRDDPQSPDDGDGDDGGNPDDGQRKLKVKLTLLGLVRFCIFVFSLTGIVCIIGIEPRLFETITLLILLWLVLFWNLFNLIGPLCGGGRGKKRSRVEWFVNVAGCIIGFNARYEPNDDDISLVDDLLQPAPKKPVDATWLVDLSFALWLVVFASLTTVAFANRREWASARDVGNILGMAWTVVYVTWHLSESGLARKRRSPQRVLTDRQTGSLSLSQHLFGFSSAAISSSSFVPTSPEAASTASAFLRATGSGLADASGRSRHQSERRPEAGLACSRVGTASSH